MEDVFTMSATRNRKSGADEYAPYYDRYVSLVGADDIVAQLEAQLGDTLALLRGVTEEQAEVRYAPGKWSLKEVVGHVLDYERVFGFRALVFARGERAALPSSDQEVLMRGASFGAYSLGDLAKEFELLRRANVSFFRHLSAEAWDRRGVASDNEVSVRALAYIMAGHELYHVGVIRERYL
jgi:hypothetical protein